MDNISFSNNQTPVITPGYLLSLKIEFSLS